MIPVNDDGMMCGQELRLRLDRLQTRARRRRNGSGALAAGVDLLATTVLRFVPGRLSFLAGCGPGLDRTLDAPPSGWGVVGAGDPATA